MSEPRKPAMAHGQALQGLVDKAINIVDAGMFSRQQKLAILRELRGVLLSMNQTLSRMKTPSPAPEGGGTAA